MKQAILSLSQFTEGSFPFKCLGVPLSPHRLLASQLSPLIHRLESVIQNWMGKYLSYAGRLELIKSVLHGMVQFWISISLSQLLLSARLLVCAGTFYGLAL